MLKCWNFNMAKFRIRKMQNANDTLHFEIQEKVLFWWSTMKKCEFDRDITWCHVRKFKTIEEARAYINKRKELVEHKIKSKRVAKENKSKKNIVEVLEF